MVIEVPLQQRHYDFVVRLAAMEGRTVPNMIERLVRLAYQHDDTKAGAVSPAEALEQGAAVSFRKGAIEIPS